MDGSSVSLIVIPIVTVLSLAAWLVMVAYADSHPRWGGRSAGGHASAGQAALADRRQPDAPVHRPTRQDSRRAA